MQVPEAYVERLDLVPDVDKGQLNILVHGNAAARGLKVSHIPSLLCPVWYRGLSVKLAITQSPPG